MNAVCRCDLRATLPAEQAALEDFFAEFRRQTGERLSGSHSFAAELLIREALNNAVVHGCRNDASRRVYCRVRLKGRRLTILVADSGQGFDWRAAWGRIPGTADSSGRGIEILRRYSTRVRFNDKGNAVTILKTVLTRESQ